MCNQMFCDMGTHPATDQAVSTIAGALVGLIVFLASALVGVIAVNGAKNPGVAFREASAAAGGSAPASWRVPQKPVEEKGTLRGLDLNGDGRLSLAEAAGHSDIVVRFERADRNKDGKLTQAEFDRLEKLPEKAERKKKPARRPQQTPKA